MLKYINAFVDGWKQQSRAHQEKKMRARLSGKQADKMLEDSFPAGDPPSLY